MHGPGNPLVALTMFGWIPLVCLIFSKLPVRYAAAISFCLGWMFLPVASFPLVGLPDYTKLTATCVGILFAAYLFDRERLLSFRPNWCDLPMALWCTCPFLSSVSNGLGPYDGLSESMYQTFSWGLPYVVGRIYFNTAENLEILSKTIILGGLVYVPFCVIEMVMSPQLHRILYGYHQHAFLQTIKGNGFRPMVFMEHGLMAAMWMITACFLWLWLAYNGRLPKKFFGVPTVLLGLGMLLVTCSMRSMGAVGLLVVGVATLWLSFKVRTKLLFWVLLVIPPTYAMVRSTGWWNGENLSQFIAVKFSEERAQSLQFRFDNEQILIEKALEAGIFGWGGWGRSRVFDEDGKDISVTDGLWIITLGTRGPYGLILVNLIIVLPMVRLLLKTSAVQWRNPFNAASVVLGTILCIYMIDNLLNAMTNPIFMLFNGGLMGIASFQPGLIQHLRTSTQHVKPRMIGQSYGYRAVV